MHYDTGVQFRDGTDDEKVWLVLTDPNDIADQITERITLDIPVADFTFLKQWAVYRNAFAKQSLAKMSGNKTVPATSRKKLAESSLHAKLLEQRAKFEKMFAEVGEFPPVSSHKVTTEEMEAMSAYVKRVIAWEKKHSK